MANVNELMTRDVRTVSPKDSLRKAAQMMDELDVGMLPVCNGERLVGILSLGDVAVRGEAKETGEPLAQISSPAQPERGK